MAQKSRIYLKFTAENRNLLLLAAGRPLGHYLPPIHCPTTSRASLAPAYTRTSRTPGGRVSNRPLAVR